MSQFPKRLIDELGDGDTRRLLQRARAEEPPARIVAAAIARASKSAHAAEVDASASREPTRAASPNGARRTVALVAGAIVVGAVALWAGRELGSGDPHSPVVPPSSPSVTSPRDETANEEHHEDLPAVRGTSVADLPDAPPPSAAPSKTSAASTVTKSPAQSADLLREANQLRARGLWTEAAATYQRVIDLGPDSAEAYPADVALGNLELQQSRPLPALARYEHALASHPNGALAEEALWGKARALRALGRTGEERAALQAFRARHSDSPLVPLADERLSEIGE